MSVPISARGRNIQRLRGALRAAAANKWNVLRAANEFKRQCLASVDVCLWNATALFRWEDGSAFVYESESFPKRAPVEPHDPALVKKAAVYAKGPRFDFARFSDLLAKAGVCCFELDLQNDALLLFVPASLKGEAHEKPILRTPLRLCTAKSLRHPNLAKATALLAQSRKAGSATAPWYAELAGAGVAEIIDFLDDGTGRFGWADGTTSALPAADGFAPARIAPRMDRDEVVRRMRDYDAGAISYAEYAEALVKAGVKASLTDIAGRAAVFYAKDGRPFRRPISVG